MKAIDTLADRLARPHRRVDPQALGLGPKQDAADVVGRKDATDADSLWKLLCGAMVEGAMVEGAEPTLMGEHLPHDWFTTIVPPREFAFRDKLPVDVINLLIATGGTGKSILALQLAASIATGRALMEGIEPTAGPSHVAILALEDDRLEIWRRLQRIARAFNLAYDDRDLLAISENLRLFCLPTFTACTFGPEGEMIPSPDMTRLAEELAVFKPRLFIADPLAGMLGGVVEENSNEAAQTFIGMLRGVMPPHTATLLCTHTSKAERLLSATARGAAAWIDASRQVLALRPPDRKETRALGDDARTTVILEMNKSNYTALMPPLHLQRCTFPEFAGVLKPFDHEDCKQRVVQERMDTTGDAILDALREYPITMQEAWPKGNSEAKERGNAFFVELNLRAGRDVTRIDRLACLKTLLADGRIEKVKDGRREVLTPVASSETCQNKGITP